MAKVILITGANGHLGTAAVKTFLGEGYRVIAVDHSDSHLAFAKSNPDFEWQTVDLSDETAVESFIRKIVLKYQRLDGALLLVGGFAMGGVDTTDGAALKKMYTLNFETAWFAARPLFHHMMENAYGRLVFMGARTALKPEQAKSAVAYALTKSMLFSLADILNATAKGKNVVASVVAPSTIDTPVNRESMPDANPENWVKPEELAAVMEFICSEKGLPVREPLYKVYGNA